MAPGRPAQMSQGSPDQHAGPESLAGDCMIALVLMLGVLQEPNTALQDIFNGKDLAGWVVEGPSKLKTGEPIWRVTSEGLLRATAGKDEFGGGGFGFLRYSVQKYSNFKLRVEYRFLPVSAEVESGNSGVGIRTVPFDRKQNRTTRPSFAGYEIQLLDDAGKPANKGSSGSLYRYAAPKANPVRAAPAWNCLEIECQGSRIKIVLNDTPILDVDQNTLEDLPARNKPQGIPAPKDKPLTGYLCLQSHSGTVEFRKVQVRELTVK